MPVKKGDKVKIEYEGKLDDGTVFDSTASHGAPLEFEVGSGQIIKGFDDAVIGMKKGEVKQIRIAPDDGYGNYKPQLRKSLAKDKIPNSGEVQPGMMLMLTTPSGTQMTAYVVEVSEETITLDLNHPLAGKTLNFKIKLVGIS